VRLYEIMENASVGATGSGSVATVSHALGQPITRNSQSILSGKYSTESTPNTPIEIKRYKQNAVGRFKNSIGH
jgi:hypothetical protein